MQVHTHTHTHTHTHRHTHGPERRVSLYCGGMNPWQHLCCTVRDPYFCHPEGGHVRRKPARMRQGEKIKLFLCFGPILLPAVLLWYNTSAAWDLHLYTVRLWKMELFLSYDVWPQRLFPVLKSLYVGPCFPEWKTRLSIKRPSTMKGQNVGRKKGLTFKGPGLVEMQQTELTD